MELENGEDKMCEASILSWVEFVSLSPHTASLYNLNDHNKATCARY